VTDREKWKDIVWRELVTDREKRRILFGRPEPTVGCSANGRRRRRNEESTVMMEESFSAETAVNISQCTWIHVGQ
jgi:hypothetical protein